MERFVTIARETVARIADPTRRQIIVVISGPPCTGKSTVATEMMALSAFQSFSRFEMDEIRLSLWPGIHTGEIRGQAYGRMHELAAEALERGVPGVVLVATYQPAQHRHSILVLQGRTGADLYVFECGTGDEQEARDERERPKAAEEARRRFEGRSEAHAATDLNADRVWDLAQDFRYHPGAVYVDTNRRPKESAEFVMSAVRSAARLGDEQGWVAQGNPPPPAASARQNEEPGLPKLHEGSQKVARRRLRGRRVQLGFSIGCIAVAIVIVGWPLPLDRVPGLAQWLPNDSDRAEWVQAWLAFAVLAAALLPLRDYLVNKDSRQLEAIVRAGKEPVYVTLREAHPSNAEVFNRYYRRTIQTERVSFLVPGVPLFFVVPPVENGFDVEVLKSKAIASGEREALRARAAAVGLDWDAYAAWRIDAKREEYFERYKERGVRAIDLQYAPGDNVAFLHVAPGSFESYLCTELSANVYQEGRHGFEIRQILEGDDWINRTLHLSDIRKASAAFEMYVGVQLVLTTSDGYCLARSKDFQALKARLTR